MNAKTISERIARASPPDWLFFSGVLAIAAGLVWLALSYRPGGTEAEVNESGFFLRGVALSQFIPGPSTRYSLQPGPSGPVAHMTALASLEAAGHLSAGIGAVIPPEMEERVPGRMLRIEAEVSAVPDSELEEIALGYFTIGYGDSGWQRVAIGPIFDTVGFCFQVPQNAEANDDEAVGIWPDPEGRGRHAIVRAVRVIIEPEGTSQAACQARIGLGLQP